MKYLVAFALLLTVASTLADLKEEAKQKIKVAHEKCQGNPETHVDEAVLEKIRKGEKPDHPQNLGAHSLCISKTLGWQNQDGTVNKALITDRATQHIQDAAERQKYLDECAVDKENEKATAINLFKCIGRYTRHQ
ncbi:uncharacterized protein LOC132708029 [Cylas formicarius]|uniref:Odorant binding protein n=1 Tax=Cylas formicarius TaxID=197179 RepID=A0A6B7ME00_CYLFO|nr:uncharacterized protein LOC132708029 [Cylas formicarius]QFO46765.1 odorant binding protein [Cylas formicarius]